MNKVLWKSLGLIGLLLLAFIVFLWYSQYRLKNTVSIVESNCQQRAIEESSQQGVVETNGVAVPSQDAYNEAYTKCIEEAKSTTQLQ